MMAIEQAIEAVGGTRELARLCGVTYQAVQKWTVRVPAERVLQIESVTGVSRHDLRPDLYPLEPRTPAPRAAGARA